MIKRISIFLAVLLLLLVVGFAYLVEFGGPRGEPYAQRDIDVPGVSYSVRVKYFLGNATVANVADFYLTTPVDSEVLFLTLQNPSNLTVIMEENRLLVCYDAMEMSNTRLRHRLNDYATSLLNILIVPISEGVNCSKDYDREIRFGEL